MTSVETTTHDQSAGNTVRAGVIMAGGSGERFWPLSRRSRPKQLLDITGKGRSLLADAVELIAPLIPVEHRYVVTGEHLVELICEAKVGVPDENVIAEPVKRNTSGCLAYAAAHLLAKYKGDGSGITMAVTTADHLVGDAERFREAVRTALDTAEREPVLVTMGIVPSRPETGYGYIQVGENLKEAASPEEPPGPEREIEAHQVLAFHEKPNRERAQDFINSGRYFWNSGMFFWRISTFLAELEAVRPQLHNSIQTMTQAFRTGNLKKVRRVFEGIEDISIDYALMEHAKRVLVVRADFPWDDIGTWTTLERTVPRDKAGNVAKGNPLLIECEDCVVYNAPGAGTVAVSVMGVRDMVIVATGDAVLVIPKNRAQDVRQAVQELKKRGAKQL